MNNIDAAEAILPIVFFYLLSIHRKKLQQTRYL